MMRILVAGGIYVRENNSLDGGHVLAKVIAKYSEDTVYLHSNFSDTNHQQSKTLKKELRKNGVTVKARNVDLDYGEINHDHFTVGSNILETFMSDATYLNDIDFIILTTDINERDFRLIKNIAVNKQIPFLVFSMSEFSPRALRDDEIYLMSQDGLPTYKAYQDEILSILQSLNIVGKEKIKNRKIPASHLSKGLRAITYLVCFGLLLFILAYGSFKILDEINQDKPDFHVSIDWDKEIDHEECSTVKECQEVGDSYLEEIEQYVNFGEEQHIFFENRTRTTFTDYDLVDGQLANKNELQEMPFDSQEYENLWTTFYEIFPHEYLEDIDTYRLFSDGEGNTSAYVSIKREGTVLAIDVRDNIDKVSQYRNLIHEFAHVYSLTIEDFTSACETTDLSCLKTGTNIEIFQNRFWHHYDQNWYDNSHKSKVQLEGFYNNNVTDFYVPYQATNVKEDFAITFTKFITDKIPSNSSQLKAIKVQSMYEDLDLVTLRVDILKAILDMEKERAL